MNNEKLFEKNKLILQGRIYPAIQFCVSNRYRIIIGIFAYYSFIFNTDIFRQAVQRSFGVINYLISGFFLFFVIHNRINYRLNCEEQTKLEEEIGYKVAVEKISKHPLLLENLFTIISVILIIGSCIILQLYKNS